MTTPSNQPPPFQPGQQRPMNNGQYPLTNQQNPPQARPGFAPYQPGRLFFILHQHHHNTLLN